VSGPDSFEDAVKGAEVGIRGDRIDGCCADAKVGAEAVLIIS